MRASIDSLRRPPALNCTLALALLAVFILLPACSDDDSGQPTAAPTDSGTAPTAAASPDATPGPVGEANLLLNPGFEQGSDPWYGLGATPDVNFTLSDVRALSGTFSAFEHMNDPLSATGSGPTSSKVYYLVQEIEGSGFPEVVRGSYYVENWVVGASFQYVQFVLIAFGADNFPSSSNNWQIRYPLAGIDSQPFAIGNAKFKFINREEPVQGEWVPFEIHVKDDFQELWGMVPEGYEKLRLLFEVRWDKKQAGSGTPQADVYWDDLYAGPE